MLCADDNHMKTYSQATSDLRQTNEDSVWANVRDNEAAHA